MSRYEAYDAPQERLGGRSLAHVMASASAGCGPDQRVMAELSILAGETGQLEWGAALLVAEMWARQALCQGDGEARRTLVDVLIQKSIFHLAERREHGLSAFAEAVSMLDELAAEDHLDCAQRVENLLAGFVSAGGSEEERASVVAQARELREWRAER